MSQQAYEPPAPIKLHAAATDSASQMPRVRSLIGQRLELFAATLAINVLSLALPLVMLQVYDRIIPNGAVTTLLLLLGGLFCALVFDALLSIARAYIAGWNGARIRHQMGTSAMRRLLDCALADFERDASGAHLERLRAADTVRGFFGGQSLLLVVDIPFALLFLAMIGVIGGSLVLVPVALLAGLAVAGALTGRALRGAVQRRAEADERRYNFIIEVLRGITTVKALGIDTLMVRRYERLIAGSGLASRDVTWQGGVARILASASGEIMMVAVAAVGAVLVIDGNLTSGALAACMLLAGRAAQPLLRAFAVWTQFQNAQVAQGRLASTFDLPAAPRATLRPAVPAGGGLAMDGVTLAFAGRTAPLVRGVDLAVGDGETVAIGGPIGAGKTTLMLLARGILHPDAGTVRVGGADIRAIEPERLRGLVCYLPQTATIFHGTIMDNLTMFSGEGYSRRAVELADRLGIHDIIQRLPKGYDTVVGEGAQDGIAGGVRQRIAVARALTLAPEPRVVLFDEANSHLDLGADAQLCAFLSEFRGRCAMVVVSHRPSYLRLADRRLELRDGLLHALPAAPAQSAPIRASA